MVDTRDLKSLGHCAHTGSSPVSGTFLIFMPCNPVVYKVFFYFSGRAKKGEAGAVGSVAHDSHGRSTRVPTP